MAEFYIWYPIPQNVANGSNELIPTLLLHPTPHNVPAHEIAPTEVPSSPQ